MARTRRAGLVDVIRDGGPGTARWRGSGVTGSPAPGESRSGPGSPSRSTDRRTATLGYESRGRSPPSRSLAYITSSMTVDAAAAGESTPTGVRVLVVDDDVVICRQMAANLSSADDFVVKPTGM